MQYFLLVSVWTEYQSGATSTSYLSPLISPFMSLSLFLFTIPVSVSYLQFCNCFILHNELIHVNDLLINTWTHWYFFWRSLQKVVQIRLWDFSNDKVATVPSSFAIQLKECSLPALQMKHRAAGLRLQYKNCFEAALVNERKQKDWLKKFWESVSETLMCLKSVFKDKLFLVYQNQWSDE